MGKMAIFVVLGFVVAFGIFGYTISRSNVDRVENMTAYFKYSMARNIAHSAVNITLHEMEVGDTSQVFIGPLSGGSYTVNVSIAGDTVDMTSRGRYIDTTYTMVLRLMRYAKPFPQGGGAPVSIAVDSVNFNMSGTPLIDGRNHDSNGNLIPGDTTAGPGVAVLSSYDSSRVAAFGDKIIGDPDVITNPAMDNPADYVQEYMANADTTFGPGVYGSNMTWGSADNPWIVYCDGEGGQVKFTGTIEGWGILVVKGSLALGGTFTFHGLVIVYESADIDDSFEASKGTPRIIGQLFVAGGSGSSFVMKGKAQVLYSSGALYDAEHMRKLLAYRILSWYE